MMSNHHGNTSPNITNGYDRTFGPSIYHFNKGPAGQSVEASVASLRAEAATHANANTYAQFYDDVAQYVTGYIPTSSRGKWSSKIHLPDGAINPVVILSAPGLDYQDNGFDVNAYQYWVTPDAKGNIAIDKIKPGNYRVTAYAEGIFGDFVYENITIAAGKTTNTGTLQWRAESAGTELWRIGTPDKSAGEFRHGNAPSSRSGAIDEFRVYWGAYDFPTDFPNGVNFTVGKSDIATDLNYVHWSVYGSTYTRPAIVASPTINNWTINFDTTAAQLKNKKTATLTIQFAGIGTEAGNTDVMTGAYANLPYNVAINGNDLETFVVPAWHSSSCSIRSGITCYQVRNQWTFPTASLSTTSTNAMTLSLPFNATAGAVTLSSLSVMYDALRLEVA